MKRKIFAGVILLAANLMVLSCGNKQKSNDEAESANSTENVTTADDPEEVADVDDEEVGPSRGIDAIRSVWAGKSIKVDAAGATPDIKQLTLAFCKTYPQCATNEALRQFLVSPDASKDESRVSLKTPDEDIDINYQISCNMPNAYIRCMGEVQTDRFTYSCFWNRQNGHKLLAVYMEECWESTAWDQCLLVFYDYDPATETLTPEPALTNMVEKRMKDYACYFVRLPEEGKDIEITGVESEEEDAYASEDYKLKWNGNTFDWEE